MSGNNGLVSLEHRGDLVKIKPKGFLLQTHFKASHSLSGLVDDDLAPAAIDGLGLSQQFLFSFCHFIILR